MTFDWVGTSDCNETGKIAQKRVNNPWNINWLKYPVAVRYIHSNHINVINKIVLDFINKFFPLKKTNKQNHKQKKHTNKRAPWMKWSELNDIRLWNIIYTHERHIHQVTDRKRRRWKKNYEIGDKIKHKNMCSSCAHILCSFGRFMCRFIFFCVEFVRREFPRLVNWLSKLGLLL